MSKRDYLISKAERDLHGGGRPAIGSFLIGPPGAAAGGAISAPKGRKGRGAAGAGVGSAAGMAPGVGLMVSGIKAAERTRGVGGAKRLAIAGPAAVLGGMAGAQGGYAVSQRGGKKKQR